MRTKSKWLVSLISLSLAAVALAAAGSGYHVTTTYKVGGDGGWDYLTTDQMRGASTSLAAPTSW